ncbi:FAD-dependent oxidoreductase [Pandoraea sp. ISTKB]|uniref:FAD-dependent oxidoreductase n=1 Tax=Pandoraea sp. ISTKB TaxID=1586708 RepID=UPI0008473DE2|nr:FAD-dependent oxidoreductase [Pandoraea sp. ISTKB]ODP33214.1 hypothetical protein A9762_19715 [Pandoraea sp. ISTKB]
MRVVIVGAGIAGTVTALALSREGHEVLLLDGAAEVARGASQANAGLISPGHCFSWAEPGIAGMALKSLFGMGDGIGVCAPWMPSLWRWGALFAREGKRDRWLANSRAALALSAYSRNLLFDDRNIPLEAYGGSHDGILYLYGENDEPGPYDVALLREAGESFDSLDHVKLIEREPMLGSASVKFARGVFCANDGTGDAARYAAASLNQALSLGAAVHFGEKALRLEVRGDAVCGVETTHGYYEADAVVVTAGLASKQLLATAGYSLPIYPVTGYSLSYHVDGTSRPCVGAVSIPHKVAWAAFGDATVRFTGFADIGVPGRAKVEARLRALKQFAGNVYPIVRSIEPIPWVGQRPMTPDNLPFLGKSAHKNLWLNCGHGAMGWTMACGSARIVTDLILGREATIDVTPYRWDRYGMFGRRSSTDAVWPALA